jgi:hypothetical protein
MIKFTYFQQYDAVSMSCFAAPRSPPAPPSALCGTAERVSAVRAGGASRTFCGAREGARGRGAQGAVAYPADSHAPARGEPRRGTPPPARVRLRALALAAGGEPPRTACRSRVGSGLCLVRGQGEARASSAAG